MGHEAFHGIEQRASIDRPGFDKASHQQELGVLHAEVCGENLIGISVVHGREQCSMPTI